jgi:CheY-like chemotaxis protein
MQMDTVQVLLADDDEDDRLLFRDAFNEIKIKTEVNTVNDGVELMKFLSQKSTTLPHILFLDLNMPRKTGMECLLEIKNIGNLKDIPIAIYSTSASEEDIEETFIHGANVYIKKPSDFGTLKKVLEHVITVHWQYQTSGLIRDNFLLSI